uniref:Localized to the inner membrane of the chloroplast n=1 Tax=Davidia involucrata TaxID=16924 RepID=A0A5B7C1X8_DAVIN
MTALSNSLVLTKNSPIHLSSGSPLKSVDQCLASMGPTNLSFSPSRGAKVQFSTSKRALIVQAGYSDGGRPSSGSIFVGGFILGGIVVGTLSCVYAPQISRALAGADKKDLMRKLPKFIYDEEKALEKTRKVLTEKIAQLNSAIDDVSGQLRSEDSPNGVAVNSDEIEAAI